MPYRLMSFIYKDLRRGIAGLLPRIHPALETRYPTAMWRGNVHGRSVALTFDDGPDFHDTPQILRVLSNHKVSATFFFVGAQARRAPNLVRRVHEAGHQIALHGYEHHAFAFQRPRALYNQLYLNKLAVTEACGLKEQTDIDAVRPPYGLFSRRTLRLLSIWGYYAVMWSVVPFHWLYSTAAEIHSVSNRVAPGDIIVLHEGKKGPAVAELADQLLSSIAVAGYEPVTVKQMTASPRVL